MGRAASGQEPHRGGCYRLFDGFRTRLTGLPPDEAQTLSLAGLPGLAADLGLGTVLATAQLKPAAALPGDLRDRTGEMRQRFHLDLSGWYAESDPTPHLAAVTDAVWRQRRIRVRYRRWTAPQEVTRTLDGLVLKSGRWYLVAAPPAGVRTYRVSRILRIQALQDRFERPHDFDLAAHWQTYLADFDAGRLRGEAVVRPTPGVLTKPPDLMEPAVARAAQDSTGPPGPDGRVQVVMPIESPAHAVGMLLRLGAQAEVVAPAGSRALMSRTISALADAYRDPLDKHGASSRLDIQR